jgi:hypothetical protein
MSRPTPPPLRADDITEVGNSYPHVSTGSNGKRGAKYQVHRPFQRRYAVPARTGFRGGERIQRQDDPYPTNHQDLSVNPLLPTRNALIHGLGAEYASSSDSWNFCGPIIAVKIPHQDRLPSVTEYWPVNSSQLVREQKRVTDAERKAGPDSRTEIKRHPGNLVLPFSKVVRYYPTHARVSQPLQRA